MEREPLEFRLTTEQILECIAERYSRIYGGNVDIRGHAFRALIKDEPSEAFHRISVWVKGTLEVGVRDPGVESRPKRSAKPVPFVEDPEDSESDDETNGSGNGSGNGASKSRVTKKQ